MTDTKRHYSKTLGYTIKLPKDATGVKIYKNEKLVATEKCTPVNKTMTDTKLPETIRKQAQQNGEAIIQIARKYGIHELNLLKAMDEVNALPKIFEKTTGEKPLEADISKDTKVLLDNFCINHPGIFGSNDGLKTLLELEDMLIKLMVKRESQAITEARKDGAQLMWDSVIISGVTIDGVDYIKLDDIEKRAKEVMDHIIAGEICDGLDRYFEKTGEEGMNKPTYPEDSLLQTINFLATTKPVTVENPSKTQNWQKEFENYLRINLVWDNKDGYWSDGEYTIDEDVELLEQFISSTRQQAVEEYKASLIKKIEKMHTPIGGMLWRAHIVDLIKES